MTNKHTDDLYQAYKNGNLTLQEVQKRIAMLTSGPDKDGLSFDGLCLHQIFSQQAERRGSNTALKLGDEIMSYTTLDKKSTQLAIYLQSQGVGQESLVGICIGRRIETMVAILAVLKAGGAYIPLDPEYPQDRLEYMVEDSQAAIILTIADEAGKVDGYFNRANNQERVQLISFDERWQTIEQCASERELQPFNDPTQLAYIIYTSGSTGKPKGVMVEHHNVTRLLSATEADYRFGSHDVWSLFHSFSFDVSVFEMWGALLYGGQLVLVPFGVSRSPVDFYSLLKQTGVTVLSQTPSAFFQLERVASAPEQDKLEQLRFVIFAGEALPISRLEKWFDKYGDAKPTMVNMYGITETTVHASYYEVTRADLDKNKSLIGVPISDLFFYLLDENGEPVRNFCEWTGRYPWLSQSGNPHRRTLSRRSFYCWQSRVQIGRFSH